MSPRISLKYSSGTRIAKSAIKRMRPATLYGSIKRLIEADLIEESDERPAPELDDARRRYYRLTRLGRRVLNAECERLQELVRTIRAKQAMVTQ